MPEALCAAGGEVEVELRDWRQEPLEREVVFTPVDGEVQLAVCNRSPDCNFTQFCTGKMECNKPADNGLNKLTVSKVILYNRNALVLFREFF